MITRTYLRSLAATLFFGLVLTAGAQAAATKLNPGGPLPYGFSYASVVPHSPGGGTFFKDIYTFKIGSANVFSATAFKVKIGKLYDVRNLWVSLWDSTNTRISYHKGSPITLASGKYKLKISGRAVGTVGGMYGMVVSAVPEPEVWALMIAGLGVLGFALRNRRGSAPTPTAFAI